MLDALNGAWAPLPEHLHFTATRIYRTIGSIHPALVGKAKAESLNVARGQAQLFFATLGIPSNCNSTQWGGMGIESSIRGMGPIDAGESRSYLTAMPSSLAVDSASIKTNSEPVSKRTLSSCQSSSNFLTPTGTIGRRCLFTIPLITSHLLNHSRLRRPTAYGPGHFYGRPTTDLQLDTLAVIGRGLPPCTDGSAHHLSVKRRTAA